MLYFEAKTFDQTINQRANDVLRIEIVENAQNNTDRRGNYVYLSLGVQMITNVAIQNATTTEEGRNQHH